MRSQNTVAGNLVIRVVDLGIERIMLYSNDISPKAGMKVRRITIVLELKCHHTYSFFVEKVACGTVLKTHCFSYF